MKRIGKGAGRAPAYKERRGDGFTAGAFEAPQGLLRPGGLFRLVFPAHSPFCMHLSETQRRRLNLLIGSTPPPISLILSCRAEDFSR